MTVVSILVVRGHVFKFQCHKLQAVVEDFQYSVSLMNPMLRGEGACEIPFLSVLEVLEAE